MPKPARPSLTDFAAVPEAPPPAPVAARPARRAELPAAPAPVRDAVAENAKRVGITTRLQPAQIKRFRIFAAEVDRTEQDLVLLGLNLLFEKHGQAPLAPDVKPIALEE